MVIYVSLMRDSTCGGSLINFSQWQSQESHINLISSILPLLYLTEIIDKHNIIRWLLMTRCLFIPAGWLSRADISYMHAKGLTKSYIGVDFTDIPLMGTHLIQCKWLPFITLTYHHTKYTSCHGSTFRIMGPLCGELSGWIPGTKGQCCTALKIPFPLV